MRLAFMADVSHELRTPLGVLHGELEATEAQPPAVQRPPSARSSTTRLACSVWRSATRP